MARELINAAMHAISARMKLDLFDIDNDMLYGRDAAPDPFGVLVFQCVRLGHLEQKGWTVDDIATRLRVSRHAIQTRVDELMRLGRVRAGDGDDRSRPGKRKTYYVNEDWANSALGENSTIAVGELIFRAGSGLQAAHNAEASGFVRNGHDAAQIALDRMNLDIADGAMSERTQ